MPCVNEKTFIQVIQLYNIICVDPINKLTYN